MINSNSIKIIYVEKGEYYGETSWNIEDDNIKIIGNQEIFHQASSNNISAQTIIYPSYNSANKRFVYIEGDNVLIDNITFNMQNTYSPTEQTIAIRINKAEHDTIRNCHFIKPSKDAIQVIGSSNNVIQNNIIEAINFDSSSFFEANSISIEASGDSLGNYFPANNNTIRNNIIYGNNSHYGINFIFNGNTKYYVELNRDTVGYGNIADGNEIYNCYSGIMMSRQKDFHIANNIISCSEGWSKTDSIYLRNENVAGYGIHLGLTDSLKEYGAWPSTGGKIYNNLIYRSKNRGIYNQAAKHVSILNNIFYNNAIEGTSSNGDECFSFENNLFETTNFYEFKNNLYYLDSVPNANLQWVFNGITYRGENEILTWENQNIEVSPFVRQNPKLTNTNLKIFTPTTFSIVNSNGYPTTEANGFIGHDKNGNPRPNGFGVEIGPYEINESLNISDTAAATNGNAGKKIVRDT